MKINMKQTTIFFCMFLMLAAMHSCAGKPEDLVTKTYEQDGKKFIVQKMPANFNDGEDEQATGLKYYRLIIETPEKLRDSSDVNYVNFGIEQTVRMVKRADSIPPAFMQRISNGKEMLYEYIVAFAETASASGDYQICMNDHVFGLGKVSVKF